MKFASILTALCLVSAVTVGAQEPSSTVVTDTPVAAESTPAATESAPVAAASAPSAAPQCEPVNKGGPIAGIVVASVFWYVLPMSIPVWITQAKKLKRLKKKEREQIQKGCPF